MEDPDDPEIGERLDALSPDVQRGLPDQDRYADGDDHHPQHRRLVKPADEDDLDERADDRRDDDRGQDGQRQGDELVQRDGGHAAEHDELALREIDDAGRVIDDVEPDRDDRVDRPVRDSRHQILKKEFQVRVLS